MSKYAYNVFTGALDIAGSESYIDGVVATPADLPVTVGTPPLDSVYLAKAGSGVWLINRKPAGLYCRVANNGNAADWTHLGAFPEVNADGNWELYNSADPTKELKFDLSGIATGTTRTITVPNKNVTLDDANDARTPTAHNHAASAITSGVLDNARINFAAPSSIGSTTANSGAFTTLTANNGTQTSTAFAPALTLAQTWNTSGHVFSAFTIDITNTAASSNSTFLLCRAGGNSAFEFRTGGTLVVPASGSFNCSGTVVFSGQVSVNSGGSFAFTSSSTSGFSGQDTFIRRDAASTIAFRDLANPQTFRIYNTTDSGLTNFERGFMRWNASVLEIGTEALGTGSSRNVAFFRGGARQFTLIGSGALQLESTGQLSWASRGAILMSADGVMLLSNNAGTDFGRLAFGGTTSSFPALKRSSTTLQVRLADDSAFAPLIASQIGIGVASPERPLHIQATDALGRIDRVGTVGPAFLMVRMATLGTLTSSWIFGPATGFASVANDDFAIIDYGTSVTGTSGTQRLTIAKSDGQLTVNGNLNLSTKNLVTDTTTGTKIGTATTQKLGFFNATPVVQQAAIADATDAATTQARLNDLLAAMRSLGLIAT